MRIEFEKLGCGSCRHQGNDILRDPCRGCVSENGRGTHWWPKDSSAVSAEWFQREAVRAASPYALRKAVEAEENINRLMAMGVEADTAELIGKMGEAQMELALAAAARGLDLGEVMLESIEKMRDGNKDK